MSRTGKSVAIDSRLVFTRGWEHGYQGIGSHYSMGFLRGLAGKNPPPNTGRHAGRRRCGFDPWVRKIPWRRKWQPTPVFLPGKFHGQRSLAGYSLCDHKKPDTTEGLNNIGNATVYIFIPAYLQTSVCKSVPG